MNKWQESFDKNQQSCYCTSNYGLFITSRQLSLIAAGMLLLAFSIFMTGYFLGKKNSIKQFSDKIKQEAFADQVYTHVLTSMQEIEPVGTNALLVTSAHNLEISEQLPEKGHNKELIISQADAISDKDIQPPLYYAQLIGFGTEKAAQLFVNKLGLKGIDTTIKKRVSKTVKGLTSYWYQVVTSAYANKDQLTEIVNRIAKEENIKDASICTC